MDQIENIDNFISRHRMYEDWEPEEPKRRRTRANGEGSIRKRTDGSFEGRVTLGFEGKKQIIKSVYAKTRRECNDKMQEVLKAVKEKRMVLTTNTPSLHDWLIVWLNEYRQDIGIATRKRNISFINKLPRELADKKIAEVLPLDLQQYINTFNSHEMAKRAICLLSSALGDAMNNGFIQKNPAAGIRNPVAPPVARFDNNKKALTHDEESRFVAAIQSSPYKLIYEISLYAGLRRGEVTALKWENIDLEKKTIAVKEAAKRGEGSGYEVGTTKTVSGLRSVPISPTLFEILSTVPDKSGLVCSNSRGKMLNADVISMDFTAIMKELGQDHTFHHLRHTFATRCIMDKGINPKVVQTWMGHATVDMTMNTYTHATDDLMAEEIKKLW